ncbi:MAG: BON domain-containing protein [Pseudomonadota bacterium]|nr:BON domain-containing protein [Pseudomonadota bacterium]
MAEEQAQQVARAIRAALEHDRRVDLHDAAVKITGMAGEVVLEGEVADVEALRVARSVALEAADQCRVADRLRRRRTETLPPDATAEQVLRQLANERNLARCGLAAEGAPQDWRGARDASAGRIVVGAEADGVVRLSGELESMAHARLAEALTWWCPAVARVQNDLAVGSPEVDLDGGLADSLRLILELDPLVPEAQIGARVSNGVITLAGLVETPAQAAFARRDAWAMSGVLDVVDELRIAD